MTAAVQLQSELDRLLGPRPPVITALGPRQFTVASLAQLRGISRATAQATAAGLVASGRAKVAGRLDRAKVYELV